MKQAFTASKLCFAFLMLTFPFASSAVLMGEGVPSSSSGDPASNNPSMGSPPDTSSASTTQAVQTPPMQTAPVSVPPLTPDQLQTLLQHATPEQIQATLQYAKHLSSSEKPAAPPASEHAEGDQDLASPVTPPAGKSLEQLQNEAAFNALLQDTLPLSPEQIMRLHKLYDLTLRAKATPPSPPPTPHFSSLPVNLAPGSMPPVIRLAGGFVTSVLFNDTTGAPWNIASYSIGDPQSFNIQWDQKGHILFIQSLKPYAHGNLAVNLWGLETPIMLSLVSGQKDVDFRVDLKVMTRGPHAKVPLMETTTIVNAQVNPLLINLLDGIPPKGSLKLRVSGGPGEAWHYDNKVYFRSKLTLLSPAWVSTVSSPDGTHVYELMLTPTLLASQDGKTVDIRLSGL